MPSKWVLPQENPMWKQHQGPHVIEFVEDINARRKKRNDRKRTLFLKAHELSVLSGGSAFVMFKDDNDQTWSYASNEDLWERYCTTGLKQESGEKRCDKDAQIISINRAGKSATTVHRRITIPTPSRNTEFDLSYTDVSNLQNIPVQPTTISVDEMTHQLNAGGSTFEYDILANMEMTTIDVRSSTPTVEIPIDTLSRDQHSPISVQYIPDQFSNDHTFSLSRPQFAYNLMHCSGRNDQSVNLATSMAINEASTISGSNSPTMIGSTYPALQVKKSLSTANVLATPIEAQTPEQLVLQSYPIDDNHIESAVTTLSADPIESSSMTHQNIGNIKSVSVACEDTDQVESSSTRQREVDHIEMTPYTCQEEDETKLPPKSTEDADHNKLKVTLPASDLITELAHVNSASVIAATTTALSISDPVLLTSNQCIIGSGFERSEQVTNSISPPATQNATEGVNGMTLNYQSVQDSPITTSSIDKATDNAKELSESKKITVGRFYSKAPKTLPKKRQGPTSPKAVRKSKRSSSISQPMRIILNTLKKRKR